MGARCLVLFGSCGILNEEKTRGRLIIPDCAVRDEGTSYHYAEPSDEIEADPESVRILQKIMDNHNIPHIIGKTWTTDALYRETAPAAAERRKEGCLCVEMECASMLAVSRFRRIPFVQFLYGSDSLDSGSWKAKGPDRHGLPCRSCICTSPSNALWRCAMPIAGKMQQKTTVGKKRIWKRPGS